LSASAELLVGVGSESLWQLIECLELFIIRSLIGERNERFLIALLIARYRKNFRYLAHNLQEKFYCKPTVPMEVYTPKVGLLAVSTHQTDITTPKRGTPNPKKTVLDI